MTSDSTKPSVCDDEARGKLAKAAEAAGLTLAELVDLISDSGLLALPPAPKIQECLTLEDLGKRMHSIVQGVPHDKRAEWFRRLMPTQKGALIVVLRERGVSSNQIAQELGCSQTTVSKYYSQHADKIGTQILSTRLSTIAGHMLLAAERAQQGLAEEGDWKGFWRIQKEFIQQLQSLGVVDRAAQRIEIDHSVSIGVEEKKAEIEKMIQIQRAQEARQIELKRAKESEGEPA